MRQYVDGVLTRASSGNTGPPVAELPYGLQRKLASPLPSRPSRVSCCWTSRRKDWTDGAGRPCQLIRGLRDEA